MPHHSPAQAAKSSADAAPQQNSPPERAFADKPSSLTVGMEPDQFSIFPQAPPSRQTPLQRQATKLSRRFQQTAQSRPPSLLAQTANRLQMHVAAPSIQRDDKGFSLRELGEAIGQAMMEKPQLLAMQAQFRVTEIGELFNQISSEDPLFDRLHDVYWDFGYLKRDLMEMAADAQTTAEQRQRFKRFCHRWKTIQQDMARRQRQQATRSLRQIRVNTRKLQRQLLYAYRDVYLSGETPEDVEIGSGSLKTLAEKTKDLLKAINEADANVDALGRSVTPLIPVLDKTLSIVNLLAGWKKTSGLASAAQKDMATLQNAWSATSTALSLTAFGKYLPLFSHIGPLLDGIAKQFERLNKAAQEKNELWWQAREVMGEDVPHPGAMPGGRAVFSYMKRVFRASGPLSSPPSDDVVEFFEDNREMFDQVNKEVMGRRWGEMPTESSWLFWETADPDKLNRWVFQYRDTVWRLIYSQQMDLPS